MLTTITIGNKITEARKKAGLSQTQLARELSISSQAVGKWERGESMPDILTFNRLAEVLGVDLNYFSETFPAAQTGRAGPEEQPDPAGGAGPEEEQARPGWDMSKCNWMDADFSGLNNLGEKFSSSNIKNCLFRHSDLSGLLLRSNNVERSDFSHSDLSRSRVVSSNILQDQFQECSFANSLFTSCQVKSCNFAGADFTGASFRSCSLLKNEIPGTVWRAAVFKSAQLAEMVLEGAFTDCAFENCSFTKVDFRGVTLRNTFFKNTNLKKARFLNCKADPLTYAFLKNSKADMTGVSLLEAGEGESNEER